MIASIFSLCPYDRADACRPAVLSLVLFADMDRNTLIIIALLFKLCFCPAALPFFKRTVFAADKFRLSFFCPFSHFSALLLFAGDRRSSFMIIFTSNVLSEGSIMRLLALSTAKTVPFCTSFCLIGLTAPSTIPLCYSIPFHSQALFCVTLRSTSLVDICSWSRTSE